MGKDEDHDTAPLRQGWAGVMVLVVDNGASNGVVLFYSTVASCGTILGEILKVIKIMSPQRTGTTNAETDHLVLVCRSSLIQATNRTTNKKGKESRQKKAHVFDTTVVNYGPRRFVGSRWGMCLSISIKRCDTVS